MVAARSFILVEVIMSIFSLSLILGGIMSGALLMSEILGYSEDVAAARDRADQVFSIMRLPLDYCGYGLPPDADGYKAGFAPGSGKPFNWDGAISVIDAVVRIDDKRVVRKNGACRIVYSIPTTIRVKRETTASAGSVELHADGVPPFLEEVDAWKKPNSVRNWVIFGAMLPDRHPMWLRSIDKSGHGAVLTLQYDAWRHGIDETLYIPENETLNYVGATDMNVRIGEANWAFYVEDLRGGGNQPKEDGVVDARFEIDETKRLLKVWLLVRGNRLYTEVKTSGRPKGWPSEYAAGLPEGSRHYRLFTYTETFLLKNF
jgi:hypothetical protein